MMYRTFRPTLFLLLFCFLIALSDTAAAAEGQAAANPGVFDLGEVVVTGEAETITEVTSVETVQREQMELTNSTDLSMALETLPGVFISVGSRNEAYLNVRGFNQRYVPVFYDGIPWYVPNDGYVDTSEISTGNLSQVTLTKGAASVLYGPNTMGGVINIVTMKPREAFEGSYKAEFSESGPAGSLNLGSKQDSFYIMAGASGLNHQGYNMSGDFTPTPVVGAWYENGDRRDNSDIQSLSGSLKIGFTPADGHEYAVGIHRVESERGLPPNIYPAERQRYWRFTEWEKETYYFIGDTKLTDHLSLKTRVYHDTYYNVLDSYDDSTYTTQNRGFAFHSTYDDHTNGGSLVLRTTYIPKNTLSLAFHYKYDVHTEQDNSGALWERYEGEVYSFGLEDDLKITQNLALVLGANYDLQKAKYSNGGALRDDDDAFNGLAGLTYGFEDRTKLHVSAARKTRFPTLNELYSSYLGTAIPNPDLKKEQSMNYEAGIERPLPWDSHAGLALFYSDIKDLIVRTSVGGNDYWDNIGEARHQGVELSLKTEGLIPKNTLEAHYTYLDAEDRSDDRTSDHLPESPKHQVYVSDLFALNDWFSLFGKLTYNQGQWEQKRNNDWVKLDSFWTVDLKAMASVAKNTTVEVGVQNAFDEDYETSYGFPREGRTFFFGVRGSF